MGIRGVDTIEWATATQAVPPDLAVVNADGKRPVVYASLVPNTSVGSGSGGEKPGVERESEAVGQVAQRAGGRWRVAAR